MPMFNLVKRSIQLFYFHFLQILSLSMFLACDKTHTLENKLCMSSKHKQVLTGNAFWMWFERTWAWVWGAESRGWHSRGRGHTSVESRYTEMQKFIFMEYFPNCRKWFLYIIIKYEYLLKIFSHKWNSLPNFYSKGINRSVSKLFTMRMGGQMNKNVVW